MRLNGATPAGQPVCLPESPPTPFAQRQSCYSMVWYYDVDDAALTRQRLQSVKDLGVTRTQALIYWWRAETFGGDYWQKEYQPNQVGDAYLRSLDYYVNISHELGMKPSFRLGSFRERNGLWHPADPSGSVTNYANWVRRIAERYRGKIDHYMIGDEENQAHASSGYDGSPKQYLERMLIPLAQAVRLGDPNVPISACATSSSPATKWILDLIGLGLPRYADGVACNFWYTPIEDCWEIEDMMRQVRTVWPAARFYSNGVGYVDSRGLHDAHQAGVIAQAMFTLWDIGWDDAPYYLYAFSMTADTKQNFGIAKLADPLEFSDAWRAYQTIAQTFYNRDQLTAPKFSVQLRQTQVLQAADGTSIRLAPPGPVQRAFVREGSQLLIYLAYRNSREPRDGQWDLLLDTKEWGCPQQIPLLDHTQRVDLPYRREGRKLVIENVPVGLQPTIITLQKQKGDQ